MFFLELKRAVRKKSTYIALAIGILIISIQVYEYKDVLLNYIQNSERMFLGNTSIYDQFILIESGRNSQIFIMLIALISTMAIADSYKEDIDSGVIKNIYYRTKRKNYLISKFLCNYILSFSVITIPLMVHLIVLKLFIPSIRYNTMFSASIYNEVATTFNQNGYMTIYILLMIMIISLIGATFSSIALAVSTFIKNKYIVTIIPFAISIVITVMSEIIPTIREYVPFGWITPVGSGNIVYAIIFIISISIIAFISYYNLGIKYEGA